MAPSNQAGALLGWSNTAVSDTSSWAMADDQEAGPAVVGGEEVGHDRHHAAEEAAHVPRPEPGASGAGKSRVVYRAQAVVQSRVAEAGLGQLALGPFVAIGAVPQPVRRIAAHFQERRPPLLVGEIKVPVVGNRGHAGPGAMRGARCGGWRGTGDKAPPTTGALLGLAHQDEPGAAGRESLVLVGPGNVLFYFVALETHDRHARRGHRASRLATRRSWAWLRAAGDGTR
jgi:hypothetical protein